MRNGLRTGSTLFPPNDGKGCLLEERYMIRVCHSSCDTNTACGGLEGGRGLL